jgi:hypothetical protein
MRFLSIKCALRTIVILTAWTFSWDRSGIRHQGIGAAPRAADNDFGRPVIARGTDGPMKLILERPFSGVRTGDTNDRGQ